MNSQSGDQRTSRVGARLRNRSARFVAVAALSIGGAVTLPAGNAAAGPASAGTSTTVESLPVGAMYNVVDQVGARQLWARGITGSGVNVAVIDTGVAEVESLSPGDKVVAVVDLSEEAADASTQFIDTNGHGTHIAGIIAGSEPGADPANADPSMFLGVAPDAGIVSVKVAEGDGRTDLNDVVTGIDWVIEHAAELNIGVINLAYNSGSQRNYRADSVTAATERAWQAGIVVVTAVGNDGASSRGIQSPANDPYTIAVAGADLSADGVTIADWSNSGDKKRNPDLAAPGAHIDSLRAPGSYIDVHNPEGYVDNETFRGSGSSQSAAVVSGAVALLLDAQPNLTPDQVKGLLMATAAPIDGATESSAGAGLLQIDVAVDTALAGGLPDWTQDWRPAVDRGQQTRTEGVSSIWNGAHWSGAHWTGAHWTGKQWSSAHWTSAHWTSAHWTSAHWTSAHWTSAHWTSAHWTSAHWTSAHWTSAHWTSAHWTSAHWTAAHWT